MLMVDGGNGFGVDFFDGDMIKMLCSASVDGCVVAVGIHKGVICYHFTKL